MTVDGVSIYKSTRFAGYVPRRNLGDVQDKQSAESWVEYAVSLQTKYPMENPEYITLFYTNNTLLAVFI